MWSFVWAHKALNRQTAVSGLGNNLYSVFQQRFSIENDLVNPVLAPVDPATTTSGGEDMAANKMADEPAVESCATWGGDGAVTTTVDEPAVESYAGLDVHEHPLAETARRTTAWTCDMPNCGKSTRPRYRCRNGCDFDLCASCWLKGKELHAL